MRSPRRLARLRWAVFLQTLLLFPTVAAGSICVPDGGAAAIELGVCACMVCHHDVGSPSLGVAGHAECGPCEDQNLTPPSHSRSLNSSAPPVLIFRTACRAAVPVRSVLTTASRLLVGEPPGERLPVLRC